MTQEVENEHSGYTNELLTVKTPVLRLPLQLGEAEHPRRQDLVIPVLGCDSRQWSCAGQSGMVMPMSTEYKLERTQLSNCLHLIGLW